MDQGRERARGGLAGRFCGVAAGATMLAAACTARPAVAEISMAAWMQHSADDMAGFASFGGTGTMVDVSLPFAFVIEGTTYTALTLSADGWLEFGTHTTAGSDPSNDCLPTVAHSNPFLAMYWDDLTPIGTNVRYGVVGGPGARTFIADYEVDLAAGVEGSDDLRFQVQLHEQSNLIVVRYRDMQHGANGQSATIGYQGAGGGAAATVLPITCNGKVLDDNRPDEGWSVDVGRAGQVVQAAHMAHSPDDITGFATLSGDESSVGVTLPFSVTLDGTAYNSLTLTTNGTIQFGTTTGAVAFDNTSLPTHTFSSPTLFYYWDDLETEDDHIRYGTVGSSPNRTFIVDFDYRRFNLAGSKVIGQVQIHERSNLINVKYREPMSVDANGQSATIGFQGAGGATARARALTFNGKVLDDNRPNESWSVFPLAAFGPVLHANVEHSPDDITGFTTLASPASTAGVTMPFSVTIDGVAYSTFTIGANGTIQFGTLAGANPTYVALPGTLPSAHFSGPTLFYFWSTLQTEGSHIRYGTVGTSPHRTLIVDFEQFVDQATDESVHGQVQIHERSNLINVRYRGPLEATGEEGVIGFQSAGGEAATFYPLTRLGRILDDNLPNAGWSIAPLSRCGDGVVQSEEVCDSGIANGASTSCCSSNCSFRAGGQTCRPAAGVCDLPEICTGSSGACPANAKSTATCRAAAGACDLAETCNGVGNTCPADVKSTATCRAAAGGCDIAEQCTGTAADCPADALAPDTTVCRAAAGGCDVAETCDGTTASCPADAVAPSTTLCRAAAGVCDLAETCDGASASCGSDAKSTDTCRAALGVCDFAEVCDGIGDACPSDATELDGTVCEDDDFCNGTQTCGGVVCGGGASPCDPGQSCDEANDQCFTGSCPDTPAACRSAAKGTLLIKNAVDESDKLVWKWVKGEATTLAELGDPTTTTDYALCFYSGATAALIEQAAIPADAAGWAAGGTGYKYKDPTGAADGMTKIILKSGADGKSKAILKGKGVGLPDFDGHLPIATADLPLIVQLRNNDNGVCWQGAFANPTKNEIGQLKATLP